MLKFQSQMKTNCINLYSYNERITNVIFQQMCFFQVTFKSFFQSKLVIINNIFVKSFHLGP